MRCLFWSKSCCCFYNRPLTSSHIESRTHRIIVLLLLLLLPSPPFKLLPKFSLAHILCNSFHRLSPTNHARGRTVLLHRSPNLISLIAGFTFQFHTEKTERKTQIYWESVNNQEPLFALSQLATPLVRAQISITSSTQIINNSCYSSLELDALHYVQSFSVITWGVYHLFIAEQSIFFRVWFFTLPVVRMCVLLLYRNMTGCVILRHVAPLLFSGRYAKLQSQLSCIDQRTVPFPISR